MKGLSAEQTVTLDDNLTELERKLTGAEALLETIQREFTDCHNVDEITQRIRAEHERFLTLLDMLREYQAAALEGVALCRALEIVPRME